MRVDTSTGYVVLRDFFTRKAQREWEAICMKGKTIPYESESVAIPVEDFRAGQERLVMNMILSVWEEKPGEAPTQVDLTNPQAWLDELPEEDYQKILEQVQIIKNKKESDAKKS